MSTPKEFTYTLFLEANPESKTGKLVRIQDVDNFWKGVRQGDKVRFIHIDNISPAQFVRLRIETTPRTEPAPKEGPFGKWDDDITDQDFHEVKNLVAFTAMAYIVTTHSGHQQTHECAAGGHYVCGGRNPPC